MDVDSILLEMCKKYNWDIGESLEACMAYIDNQKDNETFREFLDRYGHGVNLAFERLSEILEFESDEELLDGLE